MTLAIDDLGALVSSVGARYPTAVCVVDGDREVTGAQLVDLVHRVAHGLLRAGLRPGERVAVLLSRSLEEAVVVLATMVAGGIAVPLHSRLKDPQVAHVLADAEPRLVVSSPLRRLGLQAPDALLAGWHQREFPELVHASPVGSLPAVSRDSAAILLYTSGSTGLAKGIVQSHGNLVRGAQIVADYLHLGRHDHVLALLPFAFDYGLNQLLSALWAGCRVTIVEHLGVGELANVLRRTRPTGLAGVPSLWHEVAAGLASGVLEADHGRSLRYVTNSGGVLRPSDAAQLRQRWPHVDVFAMYGLSEAFRSAFLSPAEFDAHPASFGTAIPGVELLLVRPDSDEVLDGEATGELVHAGALVAQGYWRRPAETARRFRPDPRGGGGTVVYSGDLVRRDAAGRHYFVARLDRLLKVQGHRVSPDEVAHAAAGMPGLGEVAVLGVDGGADGHHIVLVVTGDVGDPTLPAAVLRRCRARLPSYMLPSLVRVLPALPHNPNGKVDEAALRTLLGECTDPR